MKREIEKEIIESLVDEEKQERVNEKKESNNKKERKEIHEEKKVEVKEDCKENEEELPQSVGNNYGIWKYAYVQESKGEQFSHNSLPFTAGLDLRTNPLEEGENDEIKSSLSMWKETYKKFT
jgi:hypothetical protein